MLPRMSLSYKTPRAGNWKQPPSLRKFGIRPVFFDDRNAFSSIRPVGQLIGSMYSLKIRGLG